MPPIASASVLLPTWQGAELLDRVLAALAEQRCPVPWDLLAVDSGSTDGTLAILERWRARFPVPFALRGIHKEEFDHGDTRNLLAAESAGDLLVFLTQDAIPTAPDWLARVVANFADPRVGAVTCRNVPRPDADLLTRLFSEADPGYAPGRREVRLPPPQEYAALDSHGRRLLYTFNDVASAVRRDLWRLHPFPRTEFGEDLLLARALLEAGWTVVYDDAATVEHSHDYDPEQMRERARIDARFNAEWLGRVCVASEADAQELTRRQLAVDEQALRAAGFEGEGLARELERARALRAAAFEGLHEGGLTARRRPPTALLAREHLRVLFVVHGFPPDTWAGTEVYTLELARELQRRGHEVAVLARRDEPREPAADGPPDFALESGDFQGLRVHRMVHRLRHERLRQSFDEPRAVAAFHEVLLRERPDVVHFQHLIHASAGLVAKARELGVPTLLHCHDYWGVCARVQLVRPDGARCERNQGAGCFLCVSGRGLAHVERVAALDRARPELFEELAAGRRHGRELSPRRRARWEGFSDLRARQGFLREAFAGADLRVSPSRFLRRKLVEGLGLEPHGLVYSENGLRIGALRAVDKRPDPEGRLRVGFVGSLVWYKGADVLVRALRLLDGLPVSLEVHGDFRPESDAHHARLEELAAGLPQVRFHGRFDNRRLAEVHAGIDVLAVPSVWYENAPITIREAFLTGTPVVASDLGGMAESVRDGVDGLLFAPGDPADLARVLRRLLQEPGLLARLRACAPRVKTIEENARECEFRYRALACRVVERPVPLLRELAGSACAARSGPVEDQAGGLVLVRPGGAVEYDLAPVGDGRRTIEVELLALGAEPGVRLGGRALLDGRRLGQIAAFRAEGADQRRTLRFEVELPPGGGHLRLEARGRLLVRDLHLRVARVRVHGRLAPSIHARPAAQGAALPAPAAAGSAP